MRSDEITQEKLIELLTTTEGVLAIPCTIALSDMDNGNNSLSILFCLPQGEGVFTFTRYEMPIEVAVQLSDALNLWREKPTGFYKFKMEVNL